MHWIQGDTVRYRTYVEQKPFRMNEKREKEKKEKKIFEIGM